MTDDIKSTTVKKTVEPTQRSAQKREDPRKQLFRVKVNHLLAEGKSRDNPIPVNDLGDQAHGRAVCYPNQPAILSQVQINILKQAVEKSRVVMAEDSGIFETANPLKAAEKQNPGFKAVNDKTTGHIILERNRPRFSVEIIGPYTPK